jgi:alpha,alpha-trehalase
MVQLLSEEIGEQALLTYLPQLEREYDFWMSGYEHLNEEVNREKRVVRMPGGEILNRYWDASDTPRPEGYIHDLETFEKAGKRDREIFRHIRAAAESGWDFSVRWFGDEKNVATICTCDLVPVDLNCLLLHLERTLERGFRLKGDLHGTESYAARAVRREGAIRKYLWDIEEKTFSDHNFLSKRPSPVANTGMVYPLFFKIATDMEARSIKNQLETKFLQPGGLLPTLRYSGEQWDAPNGWAPLQWMAYCALKNYGHDDCASNIAQRWTKNVEYVFNKNGRLTEKYNVVNDKLIAGGGEYANQDGFGWTNGVYLAFKKWEQSF